MNSEEQMVPATIVIHGGAWAIPDGLAAASVAGVVEAARAGYALLRRGGLAVDAVQAAVCVMEDDPAFDAGYGSVLNSAGEVEMDAVIMEGKHLHAGAVAAVQNIANPVKLARMVMDNTEHTLLVGKGANQFAGEQGMTEVPTSSLVTDAARKEWETYRQYHVAVNTLFNKRDAALQGHDAVGVVAVRDAAPRGHDTVGAVAVDQQGNVACATSTGGITGKRPGRVGDSPLIGCGAYGDNNVGAVSTTGHGEAITKVCLARHITGLMQQGMSSQQAAEEGLAYMSDRVQGSGGVVVVSRTGDIGQCFSTERMAWASLQKNTLHYGLNPGEDFHQEEM